MLLAKLDLLRFQQIEPPLTVSAPPVMLDGSGEPITDFRRAILSNG